MIRHLLFLAPTAALFVGTASGKVETSSTNVWFWQMVMDLEYLAIEQGKTIPTNISEWPLVAEASLSAAGAKGAAANARDAYVTSECVIASIEAGVILDRDAFAAIEAAIAYIKGAIAGVEAAFASSEAAIAGGNFSIVRAGASIARNEVAIVRAEAEVADGEWKVRVANRLLQSPKPRLRKIERFA